MVLSGLSVPLRTKKMLFIKLLLKCHHGEKSISGLKKKSSNSLLFTSRLFQVKFALLESQEMVFSMALSTLLMLWLHKVAPVAVMHLGGGERLLFYYTHCDPRRY